MEYDRCTGCGACRNICTKNAISLPEDEIGYTHPQIDKERCVDCGLCQRVCPVLHPLELKQATEAYAGISMDSEERATSSSGGAASVIGKWILESGGVVYGCAQKNCANIRHVRIDRVEDIVLLKGSKYVQSEIELIYRDVKQDLVHGIKVLFTGVPCQVAGLKRFLRMDYENLYTLDLICHGVPSQKILRKDAEEYGLKDCENLRVNFRLKSDACIRYQMQFLHLISECRQNDITKDIPYDPYLTAFQTGLSFRENCYTCPYANTARVGDITIGDYWGLGAHLPTKFKVKEGVSLILANTDKGRELLGYVSDRFEWEKRPLEEAVAGNYNLRKSSVRPIGRDKFLETFPKEGLRKAVRKAIPLRELVSLAVLEKVKRTVWITMIYKKLRLTYNQLRHTKE